MNEEQNIKLIKFLIITTLIAFLFGIYILGYTLTIPIIILLIKIIKKNKNTKHNTIAGDDNTPLH